MGLGASSYRGEESSTTHRRGYQAPLSPTSNPRSNQSRGSTRVSRTTLESQASGKRRRYPDDAVTDKSLEGPAAASGNLTTGPTEELTAEAASDMMTQTIEDQAPETGIEGDNDPNPPHAEGDQVATGTSEAPQEQSQVDPATEDPKEV
jgi:hypothetical protein